MPQLVNFHFVLYVKEMQLLFVRFAKLGIAHLSARAAIGQLIEIFADLLRT